MKSFKKGVYSKGVKKENYIVKGPLLGPGGIR